MSKDFITSVQAYHQRIVDTMSLTELQKVRVQLLGKQGEITKSLKKIGHLSHEERPAIGRKLHELKKEVEIALEKQEKRLIQFRLEEKLNIPLIDVTLPGRGIRRGAIHPITRTRHDLENLFTQIGFKLMTGPEIEEDTINFTALNIPKYHPARAMHDTFYIKSHHNLLLRTHTSTVQVHALQQLTPPLRIIATGAVYRCDSDVTHTPMFHQLEGMVIDKAANFSELKGLLTYFLKIFFEREELKTRFRASYFPFTEPSAEVDISCILCEGKGCQVCTYSGWLEVLGCGMVHPNVLQNANIDPTIYQGYAFGIGIDRLTLLRYQIPDLRLLFNNDLALLEQFNS